MLADHPIIGRRLFFPRPTDLIPSFFVEVEPARIACYMRRWSNDAGTLLHFHGNGELASEYADQEASMFTTMGINVCFIEYRGYGLSTGTPQLGAMLGDGEAGVRLLGIHPRRAVAFGRSLGSVFAIELARRLPELAGLIIESGIAEVLEQWPLKPQLEQIGCTPEEYAQEAAMHFNHRQKLAGYDGSLLVLHAAKDKQVPCSHAERLLAWCKSPQKRLVIFPNGDHNQILPLNYHQYLGEVQRFLQQCGVTAPSPGSKGT
jgi:pimeloyl-ACP methyl ester carboxylesterase